MTPKQSGQDGVRGAIGWAAVAFAGVLFAWLAHEWWVFVIRGDLVRARQYPFGTEQGWNYSNLKVYGWSALWSGVVVVTLAELIRQALVRRSWRWFAAACLVFGVALAIDRICGSIHWSIWRI